MEVPTIPWKTLRFPNQATHYPTQSRDATLCELVLLWSSLDERIRKAIVTIVRQGRSKKQRAQPIRATVLIFRLKKWACLSR